MNFYTRALGLIAAVSCMAVTYAEEATYSDLVHRLTRSAEDSGVEQVAYSDCGCCESDCCDAACCGCNGCCDTQKFCRSFEYRGGFDAWASKIDDDDSNNFGFRQSLNLAVGLGSSVNGQIGISYAQYDLIGHEQGNTQEEEEQIFITTGFYHRANPACGDCLTYGAVWDYMHDTLLGEEHNQHVDLHQIRYRMGYATSCCDEVGIWGAWATDNLGSNFLSTNVGPIRVNANNQASLYWERYWPTNARTMVYLGWAEEPTEWLVGVNGEVPMSRCVSMYGNFAYAKPSTADGDLAPNGTEQSYSEAAWSVGWGFVYHFGGRPSCNRGDAPLFDVADNGTFMLTAPAGAL